MLDDLTSETIDRAVHSIAHSVIHLDQLAPDYGGGARRSCHQVAGQSFRGGYHDFAIAGTGSRFSHGWSPRSIALARAPQVISQRNAGTRQPAGRRHRDGIEHPGDRTGRHRQVADHLAVLAPPVTRGERAALFAFDEELGLLFARAKALGYRSRRRCATAASSSSSRSMPPNCRPASYSHGCGMLSTGRANPYSA